MGVRNVVNLRSDERNGVRGDLIEEGVRRLGDFKIYRSTKTHEEARRKNKSCAPLARLLRVSSCLFVDSYFFEKVLGGIRGELG